MKCPTETISHGVQFSLLTTKPISPRKLSPSSRYLFTLDKLQPNHFVFASLVQACASLGTTWKMPFKPDEHTWTVLLSACKQHGNTQMGIRVANQLLSLKTEDPATYILLSDVYASTAIWEHELKVGKLLALMLVKKEPGYSRFDSGKESQVFHAGKPYHPLKDKIFGLLKELDGEMRRRGYVPDTSSVLRIVEQQEKEKQLFWHSERVAVAYVLLKSVPGTVIRIVKNLFVCGDCHTVLKFISGIVNREIVVKDASRYHHFKDGKCNGFW